MWLLWVGTSLGKVKGEERVGSWIKRVDGKRVVWIEVGECAPGCLQLQGKKHTGGKDVCQYFI